MVSKYSGYPTKGPKAFEGAGNAQRRNAAMTEAVMATTL